MDEETGSRSSPHWGRPQLGHPSTKADATYHPSFYLLGAQSPNGQVLLGNGCPSWLELQKPREGERKMPLSAGCRSSKDSAVCMADEHIPTDTFS